MQKSRKTADYADVTRTNEKSSTTMNI